MDTITRDEPKRVTNLAKHGLDFAALTVEFFQSTVIAEGNAGRFVAVGELEGRPILVVFRPLGSEAVSVVSMRPASRKERSLL